MTNPLPDRIPQGDDLALVMRCYGYGRNRSGCPIGLTSAIEPADLAEAERRGWPIRGVTTLSIGEALDRAIAATHA